ncbi:uncharacterized protein BDZ99DRAFT_87934 [Mytilinidion resinicola]|uniref:Uncharacterized protein n=1 Tax=Mytilinidion resinicola TaxID=574789 RepID=A0A6A6YDL3_9PEZI|nr:uncharacterized protein BDZ99DRAFT_87934 [Mytilinidion resinicola]KAF2806906.1 hypothetical protein BDZ99DRAFT_87934 [Mytilinidion resinicola]
MVGVACLAAVGRGLGRVFQHAGGASSLCHLEVFASQLLLRLRLSLPLQPLFKPSLFYYSLAPLLHCKHSPSVQSGHIWPPPTIDQHRRQPLFHPRDSPN